MIIDFHTHIFPDDIAQTAIRKLTESIGGVYVPVHDGTAAGLLKKMDDWNIDISVVQPVILKASQAKKVNEWVASVCAGNGRMIGFGGIYPHDENYKASIDHAVELGLKGLKFHAEYQNFIVDDDRMIKIYEYALNKGLILLHHAGADPAFAPPWKSTPEQFARLGRILRGGIIVAAHFGGHDQWDDVEEYLAGTDIYLDTSMGFEYFTQKQFLRIVKKHGADKILFASDSPWSSAKDEIETLKSLPLAENDLSAILSGNAKRILKI